MAQQDKTPGAVVRIYRVLRVVVLLVLIAAILLVFRKSPPPVIDTAPDAAETLRAKLVEEQRNADTKQPHALKLNEAELNSMLASSLQLAPAAPTSSPVRDVRVSLLEDRVLAYIVFAFHGQGNWESPAVTCTFPRPPASLDLCRCRSWP